MAMIGKQRLSPDHAIYVTHLYYGERQRVVLPFPMYFESVEAASKTLAAIFNRAEFRYGYGTLDGYETFQVSALVSYAPAPTETC